jgi:hypothetical protein
VVCNSLRQTRLLEVALSCNGKKPPCEHSCLTATVALTDDVAISEPTGLGRGAEMAKLWPRSEAAAWPVAFKIFSCLTKSRSVRLRAHAPADEEVTRARSGIVRVVL